MGREFKKVIPQKDLIVRYPTTKTIMPPEGATVPWVGPEGRYWRRRLRDGDVSIYVEKDQIKSYPTKKLKEGERNGY